MILDAGCGSGGFLPLLSELVGPEGSVVALDLAPENVELVEANIDVGVLPAHVRAEVGSALALPFADSTFDGVWCANVAQYLTDAEFMRMAAEFKRVAKPGGLIAVKEYDSTLMQLHPLANEYVARLWAARRAADAGATIGPWGGTSIPSRLRRAGLAAMGAPAAGDARLRQKLSIPLGRAGGQARPSLF
jgi:arsenite methyltransferase